MENDSETTQLRDTATGITRREAADILGVSVASIRRLEGNQLYPVQDNRGVWRFSKTEVAEYVKRRPSKSAEKPKKADEGEIAARVFEMLSDGWDLADIVIHLRIPPEKVRDLYSQWVLSLRDGENQRRRGRQEAALTRQRQETEKWIRSFRT